MMVRLTCRGKRRTCLKVLAVVTAVAVWALAIQPLFWPELSVPRGARLFDCLGRLPVDHVWARKSGTLTDVLWSVPYTLRDTENFTGTVGCRYELMLGMLGEYVLVMQVENGVIRSTIVSKQVT
jgi:hypothetical protein